MKIYGFDYTEAEYFPEPDPNLFKCIRKLEDGKMWLFNGMSIIASVEKIDGVEWLHVSFARKSRMPDYKDIQLVLHHFFGEERKAVMVFPEKENYVNIHPFCLHLFYSKNNPLPEFSEGGGL